MPAANTPPTTPARAVWRILNDIGAVIDCAAFKTARCPDLPYTLTVHTACQNVARCPIVALLAFAQTRAVNELYARFAAAYAIRQIVTRRAVLLMHAFITEGSFIRYPITSAPPERHRQTNNNSSHVSTSALGYAPPLIVRSR
jgi:hypothetical protein